MLTSKTASFDILDGEPKTWDEGARIKLLNSDHMPDGVQLAEKLTSAQLHKAFAVKEWYVPHATVCEAFQKRTAASKRSGHA